MKQLKNTAMFLEQKMKKKIFLIAGIVLILAASVFIFRFQSESKTTDISSNYGIPAFDNLPESRDLTKEEIDSGNFREVELAISGMTCPYCANGVSTGLLQLDGIVKTDITLEKRGGTVIYDSTKLNKDRIANSEIFEGVYKAEILNDKRVK